MADILGAVAEAVALVPPHERPDEAVRLVEHLLGIYRIEIASYLKTLASPTEELNRMLSRIDLLVGPVETKGQARGA
jgi:hypothetical protein